MMMMMMFVRVAWIVLTVAAAQVWSQALREYCPWESFKASCKPDEVIVMETARYGRMRLGRCVKNDLGYVGCFTDVLDLLDARCSGKSQCEFQIPDPELDKLQPCLEDLKSYLEASYRCVKVVSAEGHKCNHKGHITVKAKEGYIASTVTEVTGCGSETSPWRIEAEKGQIIELHLLDFSANAASHHTAAVAVPTGHDSTNCPVYANIKESGVTVGQVLCGGKGKERHVYTTVGNTVEIELPRRTHGEPEKRFLMYYFVKGCAEPKLSAAYWYKRKWDEALVGCKAGGDTWTLKCVANKWSGSVGNCSGEASVPGDQASLWSLSISSGATVAIIIIVSLLIGGVILMFGIIYIRRNKDDEFGDRKSARHIGELPYSQPAKLEAMQCINHPDVSLDAENHVSCFCEKNEYTHTWDTYPAHLAALEVGQYGGTVLVTNQGLCSLHQHHHDGCEKIYETSSSVSAAAAAAAGAAGRAMNGYSRPTATTVRFANLKNLTEAGAKLGDEAYIESETTGGNTSTNSAVAVAGTNIVNELPALTAAGESIYSTGVTSTDVVNANYSSTK